MGDHSPHDNNVDVKVNSKIVVYGNVTIIGSISVVGVGFLFLGIWMTNHWQAAVALSTVIVYGLLSLFGLVLLGLVVALWIWLVIRPGTDQYERHVEARGQEMRNRVVHAQENAIVYEPVPGTLEVMPLFPPMLIEAPKEESPGLNEQEVVRTYQLGLSIKDTAKQHQGTEYEVRKILQKAGVVREK